MIGSRLKIGINPKAHLRCRSRSYRLFPAHWSCVCGFERRPRLAAASVPGMIVTYLRVEYRDYYSERGGVIMLRSLCALGMIFASSAFLETARAGISLGLTNLYIVAGGGSASLVGRYSTRAKCIEAAAAATQDVTTMSAGNQPQDAVALLCVPGGS